MQEQRILNETEANSSPGGLVLIGAGGHAAVVYDALQKSAVDLPVQVRDDAPGLAGAVFFECRVMVPSLPLEGLGGQAFHVAVGRNGIRAELFRRAEDSGGTACSVVHPSAWVGLGAKVEAGSFLAAGCIVAPRATVGRGCIINHGALVDHDCCLGDWLHVAPGAVLGGGVEVGAGCLIGAGARVLPGRRIGAGSTVGAGAVVTRDVAPGSTVVGIPARIV